MSTHVDLLIHKDKPLLSKSNFIPKCIRIRTLEYSSQHCLAEIVESLYDLSNRQIHLLSKLHFSLPSFHEQISSQFQRVDTTNFNDIKYILLFLSLYTPTRSVVVECADAEPHWMFECTLTSSLTPAELRKLNEETAANYSVENDPAYYFDDSIIILETLTGHEVSEEELTLTFPKEILDTEPSQLLIMSDETNLVSTDVFDVVGVQTDKHDDRGRSVHNIKRLFSSYWFTYYDFTNKIPLLSHAFMVSTRVTHHPETSNGKGLNIRTRCSPVSYLTKGVRRKLSFSD